MARSPFLAFTALVLVSMPGCNTNSARMNAAAENPNALSAASGGDVIENPKTPQTDNADTVLDTCGRPSEDQVLPIYNKMNQGPVRRMVYRQRRVVTVEFIPSHPIERATAHGRLTAELPAGSVWRFDVGHVPHEIDMVTADRLNFFLPCAAKALRAEF